MDASLLPESDTIKRKAGRHTTASTLHKEISSKIPLKLTTCYSKRLHYLALFFLGPKNHLPNNDIAVAKIVDAAGGVLRLFPTSCIEGCRSGLEPLNCTDDQMLVLKT